MVCISDQGDMRRHAKTSSTEGGACIGELAALPQAKACQNHNGSHSRRNTKKKNITSGDSLEKFGFLLNTREWACSFETVDPSDKFSVPQREANGLGPGPAGLLVHETTFIGQAGPRPLNFKLSRAGAGGAAAPAAAADWSRSHD
jgi:hypothetical protein